MGRSQADLDNHSRQLNPQDDTYWKSRGEDGRPDDHQERVQQESGSSQSSGSSQGSTQPAGKP